MMKRLSRISLLLSLVVALPCLLPQAVLSQTASVVRVLTIPVDAGSEVFYGIDKGFFAKAGFDVKADTLTNGGAIIAAVTSNAADVGFANVASLVQAFNNGAPITIIAGAGVASPDASPSLLVVDKSSLIRSAKDLNGKVLGVDGLRTISELAPRAWMDKNGGDSSTVRFVEIPFPQVVAALRQHRIDAASLPEPFLTENKGAISPIGDPFAAIGRRYCIGAYFTSTAWANAHPSLVKQFSSTMHAVGAWANANQGETAEILAKHSRISPETLASMRRIKFAEALTPDLIQPTIDLVYRYHLIDRDYPARRMIY